jgi:hypothetical protein
MSQALFKIRVIQKKEKNYGNIMPELDPSPSTSTHPQRSENA